MQPGGDRVAECGEVTDVAIFADFRTRFGKFCETKPIGRPVRPSDSLADFLVFSVGARLLEPVFVQDCARIAACEPIGAAPECLPVFREVSTICLHISAWADGFWVEFRVSD
jgi:hypothetical protein